MRKWPISPFPPYHMSFCSIFSPNFHSILPSYSKFSCHIMDFVIHHDFSHLFYFVSIPIFDTTVSITWLLRILLPSFQHRSTSVMYELNRSAFYLFYLIFEFNTRVTQQTVNSTFSFLWKLRNGIRYNLYTIHHYYNNP